MPWPMSKLDDADSIDESPVPGNGVAEGLSL